MDSSLPLEPSRFSSCGSAKKSKQDTSRQKQGNAKAGHWLRGARLWSLEMMEAN
jgi:hypothetical protein